MRRTAKLQPGFALATTVVMLAVSLIALTTMILILGRSLRLTRSHSESIKAFYISEAGKSYAMWKLSSNNDGTDAETLAHCLVRDSYCAGGLNVSWNFSLPSDPAASFQVAAVSGADVGTANISSYGNRTEGVQAARRRTKIEAFKPTHLLDPNDIVYDYAISADWDIWNVNGNLQVTTKDGEPQKAGIHTNDDINMNQITLSTIDVDGPARAADVIQMPGVISNATFNATEYRGASCGSIGCSTRYAGLPTYCFGTSCNGYVGQIPMPGFDVNSALADSFKTIAREYDANNPGQKHFYNGRELYDAMEAARQSGADDGWYTTDPPITYVDGDLTLDYGDKLRVPGVLVVQGKLTGGIPKRFPDWLCIFPSTCQPNTYLEINTPDYVTGLIATNDITFSLYMKSININGLIYTAKNFNMTCLYEPQTISGVIVAKNYNNEYSYCNPSMPAPMHHQIYDTSKIHLLTQGTRSIDKVTTVYSGHWEEEY